MKEVKYLLKHNDIKKIFPFTINEVPIVKLKSSLFPNLSNPLTKVSKLGNHSSMSSPI